MKTTVVFKAMYRRLGILDTGSDELTDTEGLDSMSKLERITEARASKI